MPRICQSQSLSLLLPLGILWTLISTPVPSVPSTSPTSCLPHESQLLSSVPPQPKLCLVGWPAAVCLSVWNMKSQRTLALLFSATFKGVSYWELGTSNPCGADVAVHYSGCSAMPLSRCCPSLNLTFCYCVLDCLPVT